MKPKLPVYILIRTSKRPLFFANMMASIKKQSYENIVTIVHSDDPDDKYIEGDIIIKSDRIAPTKEQKAPFNLYCNKLLQSIPDGLGWYHFIDDDDEYFDFDVIEKLVFHSLDTHINVGRVKRWDGLTTPQSWGSSRIFQSECFFLHTDHKSLAEWWPHRGGDHYYSRKITEKLQINWIDDLIICKAQTGKGWGMRLDMNETEEFKKSAIQLANKNVNKINISVVGQRNKNIKWVEVEYLKRVTGRSSHRGRQGDTKFLPFDRNTQRILNQRRIKILREVDKEEIERLRKVSFM